MVRWNGTWSFELQILHTQTWIVSLDRLILRSSRCVSSLSDWQTDRSFQLSASIASWFTRPLRRNWWYQTTNVSFGRCLGNCSHWRALNSMASEHGQLMKCSFNNNKTFLLHFNSCCVRSRITSISHLSCVASEVASEEAIFLSLQNRLNSRSKPSFGLACGRLFLTIASASTNNDALFHQKHRF